MSKNGIRVLSLSGKELAVLACFFISGLVALIYEICWIRKASLAFGSTTLAVSTVVAVFFGGLALGSYISGRYSEKTTQPLKVYALLEIILGLVTLLNPLLFSLAEDFSGLFYPFVMQSLPLLALIRFTIVLALILPSTILMGASLPLFCRQFVKNERSIGLSIGLLYGLNTMGAVIGCIMCGFYLIPHLGVNRTIWVGSVINILIGLIVWSIKLPARPLSGRDVIPMRSFVHDRSYRRTTLIVPVLFFITGFVALGNEILWTRYLSLIIHNTVHTYTLTLAVMLSGIVIGSALISVFADRTDRRVPIFGAAHLLSGISVLILLMIPAECWKGVIDTKAVSTHLWIFIVLLLLPAILSGISFPLAIRMVISDPSLAGMGVGRMTAINTAGGIAGSLTAGFLILPVIGLHKGLLLTTGTSLLIGFAALLLLESDIKPLIRKMVIIISLIVWICVPLLFGTRLPEDFLAERGRLVDFIEGIGSNLAVVKRNDTLTLEIDRMWQGQDIKGHQIMAAHIPMLIHHEPRDVLVVGAGVGQTASRFLFYDIERLDYVELERELFGFVKKHFKSDWMSDRRLRPIIADGRNYLLHTGQRYDIISIEVGQIFRPGLASFYSADFYAKARERLNNNGIICQFIPISFFSTDEFRSVVRTFLEVFPESVLWYNTSEFLLVGSVGDRIMFRSERLKLLTSNDRVHTDLRFSYWGGPGHWLNQREILLANFLCGPESLSQLVADAPVYRDDLPSLEYLTSHERTISPRPVIDLIRLFLDPPDLIVGQETDVLDTERIQSIREQNLNDIMADYLYQKALLQEERGILYEDGIPLLENALKWNPDNVLVHIRLGTAFSRQGRNMVAITHLKKALEINPDNHEAHVNLGVTLLGQGNPDKAITHFEEALRLGPDRYEVHGDLSTALL
ncbi:MAG: fused MFS/spermidine synthase, partial [Deltaproteobacteria bacterium]|nr:fused MFS/spermidine synthase [Deltaproteobacteria bacterium]